MLFFTLQVLILPMELQTLYLEKQLDREDPIWETFTRSEYDRVTQRCPKQALSRVIIVRGMEENDTKGFSVPRWFRSTNRCWLLWNVTDQMFVQSPSKFLLLLLLLIFVFRACLPFPNFMYERHTRWTCEIYAVEMWNIPLGCLTNSLALHAKGLI